MDVMLFVRHGNDVEAWGISEGITEIWGVYNQLRNGMIS